MNKILNTLKLLRKPISTAERAGVPKVIRNQRIKPNPNAGATTQVNTYLINRAHNPWEIIDGKFVFKMGEPFSSPFNPEVKKSPISFHFTTDTQVQPHSGGDPWASAKTTYLVPYRSVVEHNGLPSNIEPMDTWWTAPSTFQFPIDGVKVLTADPATYRLYKLHGVDVEFSPEGMRSIKSGDGMRDIVENWIRKVQDQTGMRPTVDTYRQMEMETGLPSRVTGKPARPYRGMGDHFVEETNIPSYYHAPTSHSGSWANPSMTRESRFPKVILDLTVRGVGHALESPYRYLFRRSDLPALQKLVHNAGDFSHQLPTQREIPSFFSDDKWTLEDINYLAPKSLIDDVNRILRGEIVVPYKKGGKFK